MEIIDKEITNTDVEKTTSTELNSELIKIEEIEDTPFTCVKVDNNYFLALGKYRLTESLESKEEVLEAVKDASWNRIMQVMQIMIEENTYSKKQTGDLIAEGLNKLNNQKK